jgi:glutamate synthase (NADPH/NADH) small chain
LDEAKLHLALLAAIKTSSSHQEGCDRNWLINTKEFISNEKGISRIKTVEVSWKMTAGQRPELVEKEGSERIWPCDMALLAVLLVLKKH